MTRCWGERTRNAEAFPISPWGKAGRAFEQASKEGRILVANAPADLIDGCFGPFEPALRILDAQALDVGNRRKAGRGHEASLEGTFRELGALDHFLHRAGDRKVLTQPLLRALDVRVSVIALALKHDVRREPVVMPLQREDARDLLRSGRTSVTGNQVQHHIVPGR